MTTKCFGAAVSRTLATARSEIKRKVRVFAFLCYSYFANWPFSLIWAGITELTSTNWYSKSVRQPVQDLLLHENTGSVGPGWCVDFCLRRVSITLIPASQVINLSNFNTKVKNGDADERRFWDFVDAELKARRMKYKDEDPETRKSKIRRYVFVILHCFTYTHHWYRAFVSSLRVHSTLCPLSKNKVTPTESSHARSPLQLEAARTVAEMIADYPDELPEDSTEIAEDDWSNLTRIG